MAYIAMDTKHARIRRAHRSARMHVRVCTLSHTHARAHKQSTHECARGTEQEGNGGMGYTVMAYIVMVYIVMATKQDGDGSMDQPSQGLTILHASACINPCGQDDNAPENGKSKMVCAHTPHAHTQDARAHVLSDTRTHSCTHVRARTRTRSCTHTLMTQHANIQHYYCAHGRLRAQTRLAC